MVRRDFYGPVRILIIKRGGWRGGEGERRIGSHQRGREDGGRRAKGLSSGTRRQFNRLQWHVSFCCCCCCWRRSCRLGGISRPRVCMYVCICTYIYKGLRSKWKKRRGGWERRDEKEEEEAASRRTKRSGEAERRRNPFSLLYSYSEPRDVANPPSATASSAYLLLSPCCSPPPLSLSLSLTHALCLLFSPLRSTRPLERILSTA